MFSDCISIGQHREPRIDWADWGGIGRRMPGSKSERNLGPRVNIKLSPLRGRNFEYFSEDPYLRGEMKGGSTNTHPVIGRLVTSKGAVPGFSSASW